MSGHQPDLFGHTPAQGDLFAGQERPKGNYIPVDIGLIRRRLLGMLAAVRASESGSPWPPETTRLYQLLFPQMSNWLPEDERERLRSEFVAELKRLNIAA